MCAVIVFLRSRGGSGFACRRGIIQTQACPLGVLHGDIQITKNRAHGITLANFTNPLRDPSRTGRGDGHDGLLGFDFHDFMVRLDEISDGDF